MTTLTAYRQYREFEKLLTIFLPSTPPFHLAPDPFPRPSPAGQISHSPAAELSEYVPGSQGRQRMLAFPPGENVPGQHSSNTPPPGHALPAGHVTHLPPYVPDALNDDPSASCAPVVLADIVEPYPHGTARPLEQSQPAGHGEHSVYPPMEYMPSMHAVSTPPSRGARVGGKRNGALGIISREKWTTSK